MTIETATYINQLNALNPASSDARSEGDDHMRLIKSTIKATFPAIQGAVAASEKDLTASAYLVAGGTANAITLTPSPALAAYSAGVGYVFQAAATNTAAVTLNVSGLGAIAINNQSGNALPAGAIVSGQVYAVRYNGTAFNLLANHFGGALTLGALTATTGSFSGDVQLTGGKVDLINGQRLSLRSPTFNGHAWVIDGAPNNATLVRTAVGNTGVDQQVNGRWPVSFNLNDNKATFGGRIRVAENAVSGNTGVVELGDQGALIYGFAPGIVILEPASGQAVQQRISGVNYRIPIVQAGSGVTGASGVFNITFPTAFPGTPAVSFGQVAASSGFMTLDSVPTASGFNSKHSAGVSGVTVYWTAVY